jgi:hypothetical protein
VAAIKQQRAKEDFGPQHGVEDWARQLKVAVSTPSSIWDRSDAHSTVRSPLYPSANSPTPHSLPMTMESLPASFRYERGRHTAHELFYEYDRC